MDGKKHYNHDYVINLEIYRNVAYIKRMGLHDIARCLRNIEKTLKEIKSSSKQNYLGIE